MSINKVLLSGLLACSLSACSRDLFISHNGNMPTNERIEQVKVGQSKNQVKSILGSPSSVVSLDKNTWIYMSSDIERIAFLEPKEVSRDVLTTKDGVELWAQGDDLIQQDLFHDRSPLRSARRGAWFRARKGGSRRKAVPRWMRAVLYRL